MGNPSNYRYKYPYYWVYKPSPMIRNSWELRPHDFPPKQMQFFYPIPFQNDNECYIIPVLNDENFPSHLAPCCACARWNSTLGMAISSLLSLSRIAVDSMVTLPATAMAAVGKACDGFLSNLNSDRAEIIFGFYICKIWKRVKQRK